MMTEREMKMAMMMILSIEFGGMVSAIYIQDLTGSPNIIFPHGRTSGSNYQYYNIPYNENSK
jgi:hypothetical protein